MSTSSLPPASSDSPKPSNEQLELLKFLREEAEANRAALRDESQAVRDLFIKTSQIVAIPLTAAIVLAGIFFYHNLNEMKQSMIDEGRAEAKLEIQKMDKHIDDTLQDEFKTERIQTIIQNAAEIATQKEAKPLIEAGVKAQVGKAVAAQSGTIQTIAVKAVNEKVQEAVTPLANQAKESIAELQIQKLIARADADDARAFDQLLELRHKGAASQQELIANVIAERLRFVRDHVYGGGDYHHCLEPTSTERITALNSPNAIDRQNAVISCTEWNGQELWQNSSALTIEKELVPIFVRMALEDPSLLVRGQALAGLTAFFMYSPGFQINAFSLSEPETLRQWWQTHKVDYPALKLIAMANSKQFTGGIDSVYLYDQLQLIKTSYPSLHSQIEETLSKMEAEAVSPSRESIDSLKKEMGRDSCVEVERDSLARLREWNGGRHDLPDSESPASYGVWEIEFMKSCAADHTYLTAIAEYAVHSQSMKRRYAAIQTINAWEGLHLDPMSTTDLKKWWEATSGK